MSADVCSKVRFFLGAGKPCFPGVGCCGFDECMQMVGVEPVVVMLSLLSGLVQADMSQPKPPPAICKEVCPAHPLAAITSLSRSLTLTNSSHGSTHSDSIKPAAKPGCHPSSPYTYLPQGLGMAFELRASWENEGGAGYDMSLHIEKWVSGATIDFHFPPAGGGAVPIIQ